MKVCIAEKPSVAREIAQVIGATARHDGYFEGNGYQVTWTFGHFCMLLPPEDYHPHWKRWDFNTLPMLPERFETKVMTDKGVQKQFKVIKSLLDQAQLVINCGDAGQEGELIQRWVIQQAGYSGEVQRLWISSLTKESIHEGFKNLRPAKEFNNLYYAGSSRAIGDWLLGINATRLYTLKYGGRGQVLSIGRVQTPTLAMLVDRHHEIENFKPEPYWELATLYRETLFNNTEGKFFNKEDGEKLLHKVKGQDLEIKDIERKEGKEYAPKLFDLTSLQVYCNSKFGMSADQTLKAVQKLYEMKVVTYPRVDTTFLPNDMYPKIPGILKGMQQYTRFAQSLLGKKIKKSSKVFNDKKVTDHHAIIPTGEEKPLSGELEKVYDIIARRFIAVFYPDCKVAKTTVSAAVEDVEFVARGKEVLSEGWRALFNHDRKDKEDSKKEEDDAILPAFEKGEKGPHEPQFIEKTTKAPNSYTEASLLRAMETAGKQVDDDELRDLMKANGIGRPSTRASIIETLFKRGYTERQKKKVVPTPMGIQLIDTINNDLLKSAELTGRWEKQLREIEDGEYNPKRFIYDMKHMVDKLVYEVRMESGQRILSKVSESPATYTMKDKRSTQKTIASRTCPKCKEGRLLKGKNGYGCSRWKDGCDFVMPFKFMEKKLSENQLKRLLEKKATTKLKGFVLNGEKAEGIAKLTDDFILEFESKSPASKKEVKNDMPACPKCKKGTLIKGNQAYGCSRWKDGCDFRFNFEDIKARANGKPLTKELVLEIISG